MVWCVDCKRAIAATKPRVVIDGQYVCGDCNYYRETGLPNPKVIPDDAKGA